jgi:hypothetical protein
VHGEPPFPRVLISVLIIAWWMLEERISDASKLIKLQLTRIEIQTEPSA